MRPPIPDAYWVVPGRLLAGEYPGAKLDEDALPRLAAFAAAGVMSFVDLTEEREGLTPYARLLAPGTRWLRTPIVDQGCPSGDEMRVILDRIDEELARGDGVYLHCWGGHGRTGTVVGCWLVRHGASPEEALARIVELRRELPDAAMSSPENPRQRQVVLEWPQHDPDAALRRALADAAPGLEARAAAKGGVAWLGETKDLQPELVAALAGPFGDRVGKIAKVAVPGWQRVGPVDLTIRREPGERALFLAAELKWGKLDEGVWDLFKLALVAMRTDVDAAYLVTGADAKTWAKGFCGELFADGLHSVTELCRWRYPSGKRRYVWDVMLEGGHDSFPEVVPEPIETRLVARQPLAGGAAEVRAVRVRAVGPRVVPFFEGWPNGDRPRGALRPAV
jgi:protein-tyrosine phosphatase